MVLIEIFARFFALGCMSFGGPAAHIGYFQRTFVTQHGWLTQDQYSKLVALSQFLPGPGSSQVGFAIGLQKAGLLGGLAAFLGFTLPSFALMFGLILSATNTALNASLSGAITGLKLLAVVVVADAILSMFKAFCQHWQTALLAVVSALLLIFSPSLITQIVVLVAASLLGTLNRRTPTRQSVSIRTAKHTLAINWTALAAFTVLLFGLPIITDQTGLSGLFSNFYQAGSLVFGGGHVVLPLLQHTVGTELNHDQFLTGYAAAQAVPGPMFTLATYLGGLMTDNPIVGATVATVAIFLPGFLLVLALKDSWDALLENPRIMGAASGLNAAVVGLLMAAFYQPVFVSAITDLVTFVLCAAGLVALRFLKCPILILLLIFISLGYWLTATV